LVESILGWKGGIAFKLIVA